VSAEKIVRIRMMPGEANEVSVGGVRIERAITSFAIDSDPRGTRVSLDLVTEGVEFEGTADVHVSGRTRAALLAAGWVPPEQARALIRGEDPEPTT
jgi:hypothetical protein